MLLRRIMKIAALSAVMVAGVSTGAFAGNQTMGDIMNNVIGAWSGLPGFLSMMAYVSGAFLAVQAVFKFKDHVDNPTHNPISSGVKRLLAGGMMLSLPFMTSATRGTIFGGTGVGDAHIQMGTVDTSAVTAGALDGMIVDFIADIYGPATNLLTAFSYISAIALMLVGISRLTKKMEEGPRGPAGAGTMMTFLASGALFSFGDSIGTFVNSVFDGNDVAINATISDDVITDADDRAKIETVISALLGFVMLVGFVAFIRGWFVLKSFADGAQGATLAQGLTFLFGGTLAINLGELVNVIQNTVGIAGLTFS